MDTSASPPDAASALIIPGALPALLERRSVLWSIAAVVVGVTVAAQLASLATPDIAFLLYTGGRVLDGARMYRDIVEINPPLIVWLNVGVVGLARMLHLSDLLLYRLLTVLILGGFLLYLRRIMMLYALTDAPMVRRYLQALLCIALFPLAGVDFGEREHLVIALLLPFVFLVVARARGRWVPDLEEAGIGLLAGLGVALKPHFGLVWLALEWLRRRRATPDRGHLTPATAAVLTSLALYLVAIVAFTPEYLVVAAVLGPAYARFLSDPFLHLLATAPGAPLVFFALLALVALRRRLSQPLLPGILALSMFAAFLAGAAQQKGLPYHFFPARVLALALLGLLATTVVGTDWRLSERLYGRLLGPLVATMVLVTLGSNLLAIAGGGAEVRRERRETLDLATFVQAHARGRPVGVLSWHLGSTFPLIYYAGVPLASRFPHLWILPASYWDTLVRGAELRYHDVDAMSEPERWMYSSVRDDLLAARPELLIVLRPARDVAANGLRRVHYIRYFERQSDLAELFTHYQLAAEKGEFDIYQRVAGAGAVGGTPPSDAPGTLDVKRGELSPVQLALFEPEFIASAAVFGGLIWVSWFRRHRRQRMAALSSSGIPAAAK
jgi:hypothetical protein